MDTLDSVSVSDSSPLVVTISCRYGGARISQIFHEVFTDRLYDMNPFDTISDHVIQTTIRNATGPRPSLFIPEIAFELLVKQLSPPSLRLGLGGLSVLCPHNSSLRVSAYACMLLGQNYPALPAALPRLCRARVRRIDPTRWSVRDPLPRAPPLPELACPSAGLCERDAEQSSGAREEHGPLVTFSCS